MGRSWLDRGPVAVPQYLSTDPTDGVASGRYLSTDPLAGDLANAIQRPIESGRMSGPGPVGAPSAPGGRGAGAGPGPAMGAGPEEWQPNNAGAAFAAAIPIAAVAGPAVLPKIPALVAKGIAVANNPYAAAAYGAYQGGRRDGIQGAVTDAAAYGLGAKAVGGILGKIASRLGGSASGKTIAAGMSQAGREAAATQAAANPAGNILRQRGGFNIRGLRNPNASAVDIEDAIKAAKQQRRTTAAGSPERAEMDDLILLLEKDLSQRRHITFKTAMKEARKVDTEAIARQVIEETK